MNLLRFRSVLHRIRLSIEIVIISQSWFRGEWSKFPMAVQYAAPNKFGLPDTVNLHIGKLIF